MQKHQQTIWQIPSLACFLFCRFGCVGWSQKWSWGVIPMLQSTAAASQGRPLCKIAFFPGQGKKPKKCLAISAIMVSLGDQVLGDTWGVIRSRPLNWDIYIVISCWARNRRMLSFRFFEVWFFWAENWCSGLHKLSLNMICVEGANRRLNRTLVILMSVTLAGQSPGSKFREMLKFDQAPRWSLTRKDVWHKSLNELTLGRHKSRSEGRKTGIFTTGSCKVVGHMSKEWR